MEMRESLFKNKDKLIGFNLVVSEERYLIQQFINKAEEKLLKTENIDFNRIKLADTDENFWPDFKQAVTTINMLTNHKFIVVECNNIFSQKTAMDDKLLQIIDNDHSQVSVFFCKEGEVDGRLKTVKKIKESGNLIKFEAPRYSKLDNWIKEQFAKYDKTADKELVSALEFLYDNKLEALHHEIEKIITLNYDKDNINIEDCSEILSQEGILGDKVIFQMIDNWAEDNREEAVRIYRRLVREESADNYILMYIISMIQRQLRLLLSVKELKQKYSSPKKIAGELGEHPYPVKKCYRQEQNFSRKELIISLQNLREANHRIVTGKYVNKKDPLEDFLLKI